ncbi:MAG TPA: hypothetical protein VF584_15360 [Longimicrobium sp.]|jgi:hypothetical protein
MTKTAWAAALLLVAACGDEDRAQTEYTPSNDRASTSLEDSTLVPTRVVAIPDTAEKPPPPQDTLALALTRLGRGLVQGNGEVAAVGKSTSISVALARGAPGATYEGAVRQGDCAKMGSHIASLFPVSADSLGNGRASSDVPVPIDSLTKGRHVVVYGRGGRPEVCGSVSKRSAAPTLPAPLPERENTAPPPRRAPPPDSAR